MTPSSMHLAASVKNLDRDFQLNPHPWYDRARELGPVHQTDERTFVVLGYEEAMKILASASAANRPLRITVGGSSR